MVGMRMIPANDFKSLRGRRFFGFTHFIRGNGKSISRRIIPTVHKRKKTQYLARNSVALWIRIRAVRETILPPKQSPTAFIRIRLDAMFAYLLRQLRADPDLQDFTHRQFTLRPKSVRTDTLTRNRQK